jgi:polar amino acid transport system substrate-binding protein
MHKERQKMISRRRTSRWFIWLLLLPTVPALAAEAYDRPLRIAYNDTWSPYSYKSEDGKAHGILVDVLEEALVRRMGLQVEHRSYPWNRVQLHVEQGVQDAFITVPTAERLVYSASSKEIAFVVEMRAFVSPHSTQYPSLQKIRQIAEFTQFKICDIYGNGWSQRLYDANQVYATRFRTNEIAMEQVIHGNCDLTMGAAEVGLQIVRARNWGEQLTMLPEVFDRMDFTLMINKNSPYVGILPRFDQVIREMRETRQIERIVRASRAR